MKRVALIFPGQGCQRVGMGQSLARAFPAASRVFEKGAAVIGEEFLRACFEGPEEELSRTQVAQPAIYTVAAGALAVAKEEMGISPLAGAGHSLGEYVALLAAGALSFEEGLRLVVARGKFMEEACQETPGTMGAVLKLDDQVVKEIAGEAEVAAANFNCPGQVVLSGSLEAMETAARLTTERGGRYVPLKVSGAFHSPLMKGAAAKMAAVLAQADMRDAEVPVYPNVTATRTTAAEALREALTRQITSSVRWADSIRQMAEDLGVRTFVELGADNVVSGMVKRILPEAETVSIFDQSSAEQARGLLGA